MQLLQDSRPYGEGLQKERENMETEMDRIGPTLTSQPSTKGEPCEQTSICGPQPQTRGFKLLDSLNTTPIEDYSIKIFLVNYIANIYR